jgi:hypothetical protein
MGTLLRAVSALLPRPLESNICASALRPNDIGLSACPTAPQPVKMTGQRDILSGDKKPRPDPICFILLGLTAANVPVLKLLSTVPSTFSGRGPWKKN